MECCWVDGPRRRGSPGGGKVAGGWVAQAAFVVWGGVTAGVAGGRGGRWRLGRHGPPGRGRPQLFCFEDGEMF